MSRRHRPDTRAAHLGRPAGPVKRPVNPPVYRTATVLFPSMAELEASYAHRLDPGHLHYGRYGTPTTFALESTLAELEGAYGAIAVSSGLGAIATTFMALVAAGDHVLVPDSVYFPTRSFCDQVLARLGVEVTYYDPLIGASIAALLRPHTRLVFLESPGSLTFEVQDVPAIASAARAAGVLTAMDNTWATPVYFQPLAHGVDVCIHSATKYLSGHADAMLGILASGEALYGRLKAAAFHFGQCPGADEAYLTLRGLRTLPVRLRRHHAGGLEVARWLQGRKEVARVLHPALPGDPGHALWRRDFGGACGLFGVLLHAVPAHTLPAMLDHLELFGMGYSWGGFESLVIPAHPERIRTATCWHAEGPLLRLHVGLEDPADLIADLEAGFARLGRAAAAGD
jgi:cystathionine beta-lyase